MKIEPSRIKLNASRSIFIRGGESGFMIYCVKTLRRAALPPDVRWWLRPNEMWRLIFRGLRPEFGAQPYPILASRKGTALPHIGRQSRELRFHTVAEATV